MHVMFSDTKSKMEPRITHIFWTCFLTACLVSYVQTSSHVKQVNGALLSVNLEEQSEEQNASYSDGQVEFGAGRESWAGRTHLLPVLEATSTPAEEGTDPMTKPQPPIIKLDIECRDVHKVNHSEACAFINSTDDCQIHEGFINYSLFAYCRFPYSLLPLALLILIICWLFLFVALAVTADDFFCPSLVVIAKTMRMSDNIAGVTLLAFGNGAPDVFSAIAAIRSMKNGDAGLAIGALFGAGIFVTAVVAGAVTVTKPFHAMERPFLRDVIFYLLAVFFTFFILYDRHITLAESAGFIILYGIYVLVVVIGRYIYQRQKRRAQQARDQQQPSDSQQPCGFSNPGNQRSVQHRRQDVTTVRPTRALKSLAEVAENLGVASTFGNEVNTIPALHPSNSMNEMSRGSESESTPLLQSSEGEIGACDNPPIKEFLDAISPIEVSEWKNMRWYWKIYEIFKAPAYFILLITVPVVNREDRKLSWNRHLRCLNCILGPVIAVIGANHYAALYRIGGVFPVWALIGTIGCLLAVIVYFTSKNEEPPIYHSVFAFAGFVIAVIWIESIANEIVNLLQAFGVIANLSNAILGLTLMAWGNSIGDLVSDLAMAKQGFPRTAISACFGGPLFNLLLGVGIPFTILSVQRGHSIQLQFTLIQVMLVCGLFLSLLSSLLVVPLMKFNFRRWYGFYLFTLYAVFLVFAILVESNVITGTV